METPTSKFQPDVIVPGVWKGEFYGKAVCEMGTDVRKASEGDELSEVLYLVMPARLTPPESPCSYRATVWMGAVPRKLTSSALGTLDRDVDSRLLMLTLKTTFPQAGRLIVCAKDRSLSSFSFEVQEGDASSDRLIVSWSCSITI